MAHPILPAQMGISMSNTESERILHIMNASELAYFPSSVPQTSQLVRLHSAKSFHHQPTIEEADEEAETGSSRANTREAQLRLSEDREAYDRQIWDYIPSPEIEDRDVVDPGMGSWDYHPPSDPEDEELPEYHPTDSEILQEHLSDNPEVDITFGPMTLAQSNTSDILHDLYNQYVPVYRNLRRCLQRLDKLDREDKYISIAKLKGLERWIRLATWRQNRLLNTCNTAFNNGLWGSEENPFTVDKSEVLCAEMVKAIMYGKAKVDELKVRERTGKALADAFRECGWFRETFLGGKNF